MESILFFFVIPMFFGILQYCVTRSKTIPLGKKYIPLAVVGLPAAITWGACFDIIPLPQTYFFDGGGGFIAFPDYLYIALFCIPAMAGLALGALIGVAAPPGK